MKPKKLIGRLSEINPFGIDMREDSAFPHDEDYDTDCKGGSFRTEIEGFVERKMREYITRGLPNNYSCIADEGIRMMCTYECKSCWYGVRI
jgi:hypothetical protein